MQYFCLTTASIIVKYETGCIRGLQSKAAAAGSWHDGIIAHNYRTFTSGIDSLSVRRTALASLRLSYMNTAMLFPWNAYARWTKSAAGYYLNSLYAPGFTLASPVWEEKAQTAWSAAMSLKKSFRDAGLYLGWQADYSYDKEFLSQNETEGYVRYHVLHAALTARWNRMKWFQPKATAAGNLGWKMPDAFSAGNHLLKNACYSVMLDFYPASKLRTYADFSQSAFEIAHSHYSVNSFLNAGIRYGLGQCWSIKADCTNLLNRKDYEVSLYQGVILQYYRVPLRGRELLFSLQLTY